MTVLSLTWKSPYLGKTVFILIWGPAPNFVLQVARPSGGRFDIIKMLSRPSYLYHTWKYSLWGQISAPFVTWMSRNCMKCNMSLILLWISGISLKRFWWDIVTRWTTVIFSCDTLELISKNDGPIFQRQLLPLVKHGLWSPQELRIILH